MVPGNFPTLFLGEGETNVPVGQKTMDPFPQAGQGR